MTRKMRETAQITYRIHDLEESDCPRERLATKGAGALSTAELIAILQRVGVEGENAVEVGQRLLNKYGGLHRAPYDELVLEYGIGSAKASSLKAALELGYRWSQEGPAEPVTIGRPDDVYDYVRYEMSGLEKEQMWVLLLNTRNHVIHVDKLTSGSVNSSVVRVAEVFTQAIRRNATSIILVHNHPSGDPTPSPEDVAITRKIVEAGQALEIEVQDHVIVGRAGFRSLRTLGLGFNG
jgi:DNA repair protein RadC